MQKLVALGVAWLFAAPAAAAPLTEGPRLAAIYERILAARFDDARRELTRACPPAPPEACRALDAAVLWWEIQMDPNNRTLDAALEKSARGAIAAAEQWTRREPRRAEAWFYLAGAHGPLMEWMVLRGARLSAARSAAKIREALERSVALDSGLSDAYFGIGLYHYVADVAPAYLKVLRWLLLMPGGDRASGLREMQRGRDGAVILQGEADYQLHFIYLWYEHQTARALDLLTSLDTRYPSNPIFLARIAEIRRTYLHDERASLAAWQRLVDRTSDGAVAGGAATNVMARLGLADSLIALAEGDRARAILEPIAGARPIAPYGAAARAHFLLARAHELIGDRARAASAFRAAIASTPDDDPDDIARRARAGLARTRSVRE